MRRTPGRSNRRCSCTIARSSSPFRWQRDAGRQSSVRRAERRRRVLVHSQQQLRRKLGGAGDVPGVKQGEPHELGRIVFDDGLIGDAPLPGPAQARLPMLVVVKAQVEQRVGTVRRRRPLRRREGRHLFRHVARQLEPFGEAPIAGPRSRPNRGTGDSSRATNRAAATEKWGSRAQPPTNASCMTASVLTSRPVGPARSAFRRKRTGNRVPQTLGKHANFVINFCQILLWSKTPRIAVRRQEPPMRVSDDRYTRDRQRLDLALRLIRHEARTFTIRQWTGLSDDRIRKLYRSYVLDHGAQFGTQAPRQVPAAGGVFLQKRGTEFPGGAAGEPVPRVRALARDRSRTRVDAIVSARWSRAPCSARLMRPMESCTCPRTSPSSMRGSCCSRSRGAMNWPFCGAPLAAECGCGICWRSGARRARIASRRVLPELRGVPTSTPRPC